MTAGHRLHDVRVALEIRDLPEAVVAPFVAYLGPDTADGEAADLDITLAAAATPPEAVGARIFEHGNVQGRLDGDSIWLDDGASRIRVSRAGDRLDARLHPASLVDPESAVHHLLFIGLAIALRGHRLFHCHAGALAAAGGPGVLVAGEGGSGKTTVTLALAAAGWRVLGDDAVWLQEQGGRVRALRVSRPFHLSERTAGMFPDLAAGLSPRRESGSKRQALDPVAAFPDQQQEVLEAPALLLFPEVADRDLTRIRPLAPVEAYDRLLRSTALVVVDGMPRRRESLAVVERLLFQSHQLALDLGRDLVESPAAILTHLEPHLQAARGEEGG